MKSNVKIKLNPNALKNTLNNAISNANFNIECPNCHSKFLISGSSFGNSVVCPNCNLSIVLNNDQLTQDIDNLHF